MIIDNQRNLLHLLTSEVGTGRHLRHRSNRDSYLVVQRTRK